MMFLQLARGEQPTGDFRFRDGVMLLDAYHDCFRLYALFVDACFRTADRVIALGRKAPESAAATSVATGFRATLKLYSRDYLNFRPKVLCPEVGSVFSDPSHAAPSGSSSGK